VTYTFPSSRRVRLKRGYPKGLTSFPLSAGAAASAFSGVWRLGSGSGEGEFLRLPLGNGPLPAGNARTGGMPPECPEVRGKEARPRSAGPVPCPAAAITPLPPICTESGKRGHEKQIFFYFVGMHKRFCRIQAKRRRGLSSAPPLLADQLSIGLWSVCRMEFSSPGLTLLSDREDRLTEIGRVLIGQDVPPGSFSVVLRNLSGDRGAFLERTAGRRTEQIPYRASAPRSELQS